jgi:gamma-glutamylcyclotransferase (GGCT)/AIG2-like uncharacterized protein YtfP
MTTVFVYGTLKRGGRFHSALRKSEFLGEAKTTPEYLMYSNGSYPCLVKADEGKGKSIEGELWKVDDLTLATLDRIEGSPTLFRKAKINLDTHPDLEANAYFYVPPDLRHMRECGVCWK